MKISDFASLDGIRKKAAAKILPDKPYIAIGMGTCGIAAGAREVLAAILDEIARLKIQDVIVTQTGCIGMCEQEVLVDIVKTDQPRISYGKVTADFVPTLVNEHVVNGRIVEERVIGKITK